MSRPLGGWRSRGAASAWEGFPHLITAALDLLGRRRAVHGPIWLRGAVGAVELARSGRRRGGGVDLDFSMLRMAERVRREGRAVLRCAGSGSSTIAATCCPDVPRERLSFGAATWGRYRLRWHLCGALSLNVIDACRRSGPWPSSGDLAPEAVLLSSHTTGRGRPAARAVVGGNFQSQRGARSSAASCGASCRRTRGGVDTGSTSSPRRDRVRWRRAMNERASMETRAPAAPPDGSPESRARVRAPLTRSGPLTVSGRWRAHRGGKLSAARW